MFLFVIKKNIHESSQLNHNLSPSKLSKIKSYLFWTNFLIMYNKAQFEVEMRLMSIATLHGP